MSENASQWKITLALGTVYLVWGSTFLAIRIAVATIPPFFLAALRFLSAGVILYVFGCFQTVERPSLAQWKRATITGVLLLATGNGLVVWAEVRISSGLAALIISTVPIWMVCLPAFYARSQRPTGRVILGLLMGLLGVSILVPRHNGSFSASDATICLALLTASFSWAFGTLYSKRAALPQNNSLTAGMEMMTGGIVLLLMSGLSGEWGAAISQAIPSTAWFCLIYLILFGSVIAFSAYVWLTTRISTKLLATYAYVNPLVAVFLGWFFLGEPLTSQVLGGAALILGAVTLISWN